MISVGGRCKNASVLSLLQRVANYHNIERHLSLTLRGDITAEAHATWIRKVVSRSLRRRRVDLELVGSRRVRRRVVVSRGALWCVAGFGSARGAGVGTAEPRLRFRVARRASGSALLSPPPPSRPVVCVSPCATPASIALASDRPSVVSNCHDTQSHTTTKQSAVFPNWHAQHIQPHNNKRTTTQVWYLKASPKDFVRELSQHLCPMTFAPNEVLDMSQTMYIVRRGLAAKGGRPLAKDSVSGMDFVLDQVGHTP